MTTFEQRLSNRSYKRVLKMLKTDFDGWARHKINILDLSPKENGLSHTLSDAGYSINRLINGVPVKEPLDLILYEGPAEPEVDLLELVETFQPGFELIIINTPVSFRSESDGFEINPENFGIYRMLPVSNWVDWLLGQKWRDWVSKRPVFKIKTVRVV